MPQVAVWIMPRAQRRRELRTYAPHVRRRDSSTMEPERVLGKWSRRDGQVDRRFVGRFNEQVRPVCGRHEDRNKSRGLIRRDADLTFPTASYTTAASRVRSRAPVVPAARSGALAHSAACPSIIPVLARSVFLGRGCRSREASAGAGDVRAFDRGCNSRGAYGDRARSTKEAEVVASG